MFFDALGRFALGQISESANEKDIPPGGDSGNKRKRDPRLRTGFEPVRTTRRETIVQEKSALWMPPLVPTMVPISPLAPELIDPALIPTDLLGTLQQMRDAEDASDLADIADILAMLDA